jgi:hypothetical protein
MKIIFLQIILLCFALFMLYTLFLHWKKKNITNIIFGFWVFVWVVFLFFNFCPQILEPLLKELFVVRVMDLGMIGAFMILTYLTVENNIKIKKYEELTEKLVRKISVKKIKIKK